MYNSVLFSTLYKIDITNFVIFDRSSYHNKVLYFLFVFFFEELTVLLVISKLPILRIATVFTKLMHSWIFEYQ